MKKTAEIRRKENLQLRRDAIIRSQKIQIDILCSELAQKDMLLAVLLYIQQLNHDIKGAKNGRR